MRLWDGLLGSLGALLLGSLLAGAVAVALSPLGPLGPVRPFLSVAVHPDWAVIGIGVLALVLVLSGVAVLPSSARCPPAVDPGRGRFTSSRVTTAATRAGLPPAAVTGVRFALEPGVGRSTVPVRSAILGAILARDRRSSPPSPSGRVWVRSRCPTRLSTAGTGTTTWTVAAGSVTCPVRRQRRRSTRTSRAGLDRRVLLLADRGRGERAGPGRHARGRRRPAPPERPRPAGGQPGGARRLDVALLARAVRRHRGRTHPRQQAGDAQDRVGTATLPPIGVVGSSHLEMGTGAMLSYRIIPALGTQPLREQDARAERHPRAHQGGQQPRARRRCNPSGAGWTSPPTAAPCSGWYARPRS